MIDGRKFQLIQDFFSFEQHPFTPFCWTGRAGATENPSAILLRRRAAPCMLQSQPVYHRPFGIAVFPLIYIVELAQDNVKSLFQGVKVDEFFSRFIATALDPKSA